MTDDLRKLAEAVISARKALRGHVCMYEDDRLPCQSTLHDDMLAANEAYIAAASPAVVLGLLDRIAELEASNRYKYGDGYEAAGIALVGERDEARAAVKRLAGALETLENNVFEDGAPDEALEIAQVALADPIVRRIVEGG